MKKHKPLKIILLVLLALPGLLFWYAVCMPSVGAVLYVDYHVYIRQDWPGANLDLQKKNIAIAPIVNGTGFKAYGYSFTLPAGMSIEKTSDHDTSRGYVLSGKRALVLNAGYNYHFTEAYKDSEIGIVTGLPLDCDYNVKLADHMLTPRCFTLFNDKANMDIAKRLTVKASADKAISARYDFNTRNIVGFESVYESATLVEFFRIDDLNELYSIVFLGFGSNEIDSAIGTIQFDS